MKLKLLLLLLLTSAFLVGQSKEELLRSLGHGNLSPAGQDTIYKYAQSHAKELWEPSWNLMILKPLPEVKQNFRAFFTGKLSPEDLTLLDAHWEEKQQKYVAKISAQTAGLEAALACQEVAFDSLMQVHFPILEAFKAEIETKLTKFQISQLFSYYRASLVKLRLKRDEFLEHARVFNTPISPASEHSLAYGFAIMERIPSVYYYNLVGHVEIPLDFADEHPLDAYTAAYGRFMDDILFVLDDRNCRGNAAIPFYHDHLREQEDLLRRDALLFAAIQFLEEPAAEDIVAEAYVPKYFPEADTLIEFQLDVKVKGNSMMENPLVALVGYGYSDISEAASDIGGKMFAELVEGMPRKMVIAQMHTSPAMKQEAMEGKKTTNWRQIPGLKTVVYFRAIDGRSAIKNGPSGVEFLISHKGALLEGAFMGQDIKEEDVIDLLQKIGVH